MPTAEASYTGISSPRTSWSSGWQRQGGDFGIARLASAAQNTLTQEALGSVHYISPEQARAADRRAQRIYSAGVVLYEMLTGRLPFEGDTPVSVAIQHINSIPLPPRELNPDIPEALEASR